MIKKIIWIICLFLVILSDISSQERIISLAPAITDIIQDLDKEEQLVGVTKFCKIKNSSIDIQRIGGYLNPSYEKMLRLKPTKVFLYPENEKTINFSEKNNIKYYSFKHKEIKDIYNTYLEIGEILNVKNKAVKLIENMKSKIKKIKKQSSKKKSIKAIVVIGRKKGRFNHVYIAGSGEFIGQILKILNLKNGYKGSIAYPKMNVEGIIRVNPDIIIEIIPELVEKYDVSKLKEDWSKYKPINAVKNDNIIILKERSRIIPSNNIIEVIENIFIKLYGYNN